TQKYVLYFCSHCARYMPALAPETFGFRGAASCRANRKSTSCTFALTARGTCPRLLRKPSVSAARHPAAPTAKTPRANLPKWQARRESNPQPAVLETAALPIELL